MERWWATCSGRATAWKRLNEFIGPCLSVVIVATDSPRAIARAVASWSEPRHAGEVERIVVARQGMINSGSDVPGIDRLVVAPSGSSVPRMRRLGIEQAEAPVVLFTEDSCEAEDGCLTAWLGAIDEPDWSVMTGQVVPANDLALLDRAVFLCEYAPFLPGAVDGDGALSRLAGNHFAIRRLLGDWLDPAEIHESEAATVVERSHLAQVPAARVRHGRRFAWTEAFRDRLRYGWEYGRRRAVGLSPRLRVAGLGVLPLILAAQVKRAAGLAHSPRGRVARLRSALPLATILLLVWSIGEWAGWSSVGLATIRRWLTPASRRPHEKAVRPRARRGGRPRSSVTR